MDSNLETKSRQHVFLNSLFLLLLVVVYVVFLAFLVSLLMSHNHFQIYSYLSHSPKFHLFPS